MVDKRFPVGKGIQDLRTVQRSASSHEPDRIKAGNDTDEIQDRGNGQGLLDDGQRDRPEALPAAGSVDLGALINVIGDPLQCGQDKDHLKRDPLPDRDQDHAPECGIHISQPGDGFRDHPQLDGQDIDDPHVCVK